MSKWATANFNFGCERAKQGGASGTGRNRPLAGSKYATQRKARRGPPGGSQV